MSEGLGRALLREVSDWQGLGGGSTEWDRPVVPEPYFIPFLGHGFLLRQPPLEDDGRQPTVLSRLRERIASALGGGAPPSAPPEDGPPEALMPLLTGEAPDYIADPRTELAHHSWLLPGGMDWNQKDWEGLLFPLGASEFPVCLEILATGGEIRFGWAVEPSDEGALADAAAATGTAVQPQDDPLMSWMVAHDAGSLSTFELGLREEFINPIRSDFRSDPYGPLLGALSRVPSGEMVAVQILLSACRNPWAASIWRSVTDEDGGPFAEDGQRLVRAAREKCSTPLFAASVRLSFLTEGCDDSSVPVLNALGCFDGSNGFGFRERSGDEEVSDLLRRSFRSSGMILNAAELYALVHPPSEGVGGGALRRMEARTRPAPQSANGARGLLLGTNEHAGSVRECRIPYSDRLRHMHVLGASGTGKSTFLLNMMLQDLEEGRGFALLDPHGDLVEAVLDRMPDGRIPDVVVFDPADSEFPVGFNILRAHTEVERNLLASDFVAIFERLSTSWGDQMSAVLGNAALAILESDRGGTLVDLKRFLIEKAFRDRFLEGVRDPEVVYFWKREFPLLRGTTQGSLLTRLSGFLRHRLIRNMVSQEGARFDVARMMAEGKVILAPLSQGLIGQENSWLLGSLLVSRFHQAALSRQSQGEGDRRPFFLYLDEAHNFMTPSIGAILSGARKYGLGLVLAHQELDQFPARESGILGSVLANCHARVCFRLGDRDAERLESGFSHFQADDLRRLGTGEAVCRIGGSDGDFNLRTADAPRLSPGHAERRACAVEHSRATYAKPRAEVEEASDSSRPQEAAPDARDTASNSNRRPTAERRSRPPEEEAVPLSPPQEPAPPPDVPATPNTAEAPPPEERLPGRGGPDHRRLQQVIKAHGNGLGLRATVEAELPDRAGCIDVLLEGATTSIAFEIADRSPIEQEARNVRKCVEAGIPEVYVVSADPAHLTRIRAAAELDIGADALGGVRFIDPSRIGDAFAEIGARLAGSETTSRGYRVKVSYSAPPGDVREARSREVHRAVSDGRAKGGQDE